MTLGFDRESRIIGGKLAAVALLTLMAGGAGSCTSEANNSLTVVWAQVPMSSDKGCTIPGAKGMTYLPSGKLDVGLDQQYPYNLYPLVENNLPKAKSGVVEYNAVNIKGVDVKLVPPPGVTFTTEPGCPAEFSDPISLKVDPAGSAALVVQAIKPCHVVALRKMFMVVKPAGLSPDLQAQEIFTAIVRVRGDHGGTEIESPPFSFPIRVCLGCLQTGFTEPGFEDFDYKNGVADCRNLLDNPYKGNPCNIAQDWGPVLCCSTDGTGSPASLECPGRPRGVPPATMP